MLLSPAQVDPPPRELRSQYRAECRAGRTTGFLSSLRSEYFFALQNLDFSVGSSYTALCYFCGLFPAGRQVWAWCRAFWVNYKGACMRARVNKRQWFKAVFSGRKVLLERGGQTDLVKHSVWLLVRGSVGPGIKIPFIHSQSLHSTQDFGSAWLQSWTKKETGQRKNSIEKSQSRISVNWVINRIFLFFLSNVLVFIKLTHSFQLSIELRKRCLGTGGLHLKIIFCDQEKLAVHY